MDTKIIQDVGLWWCAEHGTFIIYVEFEDGSTEDLTEIEPKKVPNFAKHWLEPDYEMTDADNAEYGEWHDIALDVAHKYGYVLEGEAN